jgi:hypothetical protein
VTLPAAAYHEPATYERERRAIFAAEWQPAGFRDHLRLSPRHEIGVHSFQQWVRESLARA